MHLLVVVSPHGFGHAAQVAPVINALVRRLPALRVTVQSTVAPWFLRQRIDTDFQLVERRTDFGLMMNSALDIDLESSASAYADLHGSWEARVSEEASRLRALAPDLVLADVPYLSVAAAQAAEIPALALCSLNWADIYRNYFAHRREARHILEQMEAAYSAAGAFLCPEPCMPMGWLNNAVNIAPIAARGQNRRAALNELLGLDSSTALVVVAPGEEASFLAPLPVRVRELVAAGAADPVLDGDDAAEARDLARPGLEPELEGRREADAQVPGDGPDVSALSTDQFQLDMVRVRTRDHRQ